MAALESTLHEEHALFSHCWLLSKHPEQSLAHGRSQLTGAEGRDECRSQRPYFKHSANGREQTDGIDRSKEIPVVISEVNVLPVQTNESVVLPFPNGNAGLGPRSTP